MTANCSVTLFGNEWVEVRCGCGRRYWCRFDRVRPCNVCAPDLWAGMMPPVDLSSPLDP